MKNKVLIIILTSIYSINVNAQDITTNFTLPDSIRAIQFMSEFNIKSVPAKKEGFVGIKADGVSLVLESEKGKNEFEFSFPKGSKVVVVGKGVDQEQDGPEWKYQWKLNETYKLVIAVASDSAENYSLYSGYAWLPTENKWKLIGTCRIEGKWGPIKEPAAFYSGRKKNKIGMANPTAWVQRTNGGWWNLQKTTDPSPQVVVTNHVDSLEQVTYEHLAIQNAIRDGKSEPLKEVDGIYYSIMKEGTGRNVLVSDTVVAYYKGYLFSDGSVFDQTKENPATFPLRRLIRGWQIGVPLCKVGGKIKLVIPSGLGYSIRTRAAKIPPNSILVFEIEVVSLK
jgi:FKBP-type peptidyl-prolyl cis-trans isomerase FkpA